MMTDEEGILTGRLASGEAVPGAQTDARNQR